MLAFLLFAVIMVVASGALLINHVSGLRSRVEIGASELIVQQRRLEKLKQELISAAVAERSQIEHGLMSAQTRVDTCLLMHATALRSYEKVTTLIPGSLVAQWFSLSATAKDPQVGSQFLIDLTEGEEKGLTFSPTVVQLP